MFTAMSGVDRVPAIGVGYPRTLQFHALRETASMHIITRKDCRSLLKSSKVVL